MKATDFLHALRLSMPTEEELRLYGLDENEIGNIQGGFMATPRAGAPSPPLVAGEIGQLVERYDCKSIEVGIVHFDQKLTSAYDGYKFGACESDPLVINHLGNVLMYEHSNAKHPPEICAISPEKFLDALAAFVEIRASRAGWAGKVEDAIKKCCLASGVSSARSFYASICSFLDV